MFIPFFLIFDVNILAYIEISNEIIILIVEIYNSTIISKQSSQGYTSSFILLQLLLKNLRPIVSENLRFHIVPGSGGNVHVILDKVLSHSSENVLILLTLAEESFKFIAKTKILLEVGTLRINLSCRIAFHEYCRNSFFFRVSPCVGLKVFFS